MTLIVGIRCIDGVVVGADGAATLGDGLLQRTVIQPMHKLRVLDESLIMGVSGPVGLGQLYCDRIETFWKKAKPSQKVELPDVQRSIHDAIALDANKAVEDAKRLAGLLGNSALAFASTASVVAVPVKGRAELIQCDLLGRAEAASDDLPYVAIGSGQGLADPFLVFLRRVFWPDSSPNLSQGTFAVVWTLRHAIVVNAGGVSDPVQLAILAEDKSGKLSARLLSNEQIEEHQQNVVGAESFISRYTGLDS